MVQRQTLSRQDRFGATVEAIPVTTERQSMRRSVNVTGLMI